MTKQADLTGIIRPKVLTPEGLKSGYPTDFTVIVSDIGTVIVSDIGIVSDIVTARVAALAQPQALPTRPLSS